MQMALPVLPGARLSERFIYCVPPGNELVEYILRCCPIRRDCGYRSLEVMYPAVHRDQVHTCSECPCDLWARLTYNHQTEPQIRRDHPLHLSLSISGGKETNKDSISNCERSGKSSTLKSLADTVRELWPGEATIGPDLKLTWKGTS